MAGCSVFTRPSRISGEPVTTATARAGTPAASSARNVPPVSNRLADLAQVMQVQGLQQQGELGRMKMDEFRRDREQENVLNTAYSSALGADGKVDRNKLLSALATGGLGSKIPGVQKGFAESDKASAEAQGKLLENTKKRVDLAGQAFGFVRANPTLETANQAIDFLGTNGVWDAAQVAQYKAQVAADPSKIGALAEQAFRQALDAKEQLAKYETRNLGGTTDTVAIDPVTGQARTVNSVQNTQSPDSIASTAIQRDRLAEDKRHRGITEQQGAETLRLKKAEIEGQSGSGAPVLGVPVPVVLPWANQSNPKDANKVKATEMSRGSKEIEKDVDAARKLEGTARDAARFIELNSKIPTGGLLDKTALTRWAQGMGAEYAEMESITARLAPAMREPGSGSTSDFDGKQFERATVGVDKPKQANENIAKAVVARAQQAQEYADFRQTYLEQNGTLQGAERHWKEYVNANPIFDTKKPGEFTLNADRKSWSEHFKAKTSAKPEAAKPHPAAGGLSAEEQEELARLRKLLGRGGQ
jgi:hypothetical protein